MAERTRIDLFCEDREHEQFVRALLGRLAAEEGLRPIVRASSTRGGHGKALSEFKIWQRRFQKHEESGLPDLLILVIDGNCSGWNEAHRRLEAAVNSSVLPRSVVGCPNPHVERWYLADPVCFQLVVGAAPGPDPGKCERLVYKKLVEEAVFTAGIPLLTGTADLAPDLVDAMDLYRAAKNDPSLGKFVEDLKAALRQIAG